MIGALAFWFGVALVAYVYVGYPVAVTAIARLRRAVEWPAGPLPKITLIIAAYDEEREIGPKLDAVLGLDYPRELLQVIVAADGSSDRTPDIVRRYTEDGVELVHRPERQGKMAALGNAAQWATGDILVFSDANNRFDLDALRRLVAPFTAEGVGMTIGYKTATGPDGLGGSEGAYWRYEAHIRRMETRLGCTVGVNGEIFAVRRHLFRAAPPEIINDDQWLSHQLIMDGHDVVFCHDAVSRELVSASAAGEQERRSRMVAGQYQVFSPLHRSLPWRRPLVTWMFVSHKLLRPLVPFGMAAAAIGSVVALIAPPETGGLLMLAPPWAAIAVLAQLAFYGMAVLGSVLETRVHRVAYVPRFLVDSNLAAVRGLWRHLRGTQPATWDRVERRVHQ